MRAPGHDHGFVDLDPEDACLSWLAAGPPRSICIEERWIDGRHRAAVDLELTLRAIDVADRAVHDNARVTAQVVELGRGHDPDDELAGHQVWLDRADPRRAVLADRAQQRDPRPLEAGQALAGQLRRSGLEVAPAHRTGCARWPACG